jgi:hypothetical protein
VLRREDEHFRAVIDRLRRAPTGERPLQEGAPTAAELEQVVLGAEGQRGEGLAEGRLVRLGVPVERSGHPATGLAEEPGGKPIGEAPARSPDADPGCDRRDTKDNSAAEP